MKSRTLNLPPGPRYAALLESMRNGVPEPAWLATRRREAFERLAHDGFPTRHVENWKYTDISGLADRELVLSADTIPEALPVAGLPFHHDDDIRIVFVNGRYAQALSTGTLPNGLQQVRLHDLEADPDPDPADTLPSALLNAAFRRDGMLLRIDAKLRIEPRINILLVQAGDTADTLIAPWLAIEAGAMAEARIAITSVSCTAAPCVNVPRVIVTADAGAQLAVSQSQALNTASWQLGTTRIEQRRDSRVTHLDAALGGSLQRHDLACVLLESGAESELDGFYALRGKQHTDFHTLIEHRQPDSRSRQIYKGILDERAVAVFNGIVKVFPKASGTDGYQLNRALLLSRDAQVYTKPELQIDNDDVRCSHGATIGQLDPQELFYLQSRGIPEALARQMLARAFVEDVLFRQPDARQRADLDTLLDDYFAPSEG